MIENSITFCFPYMGKLNFVYTEYTHTHTHTHTLTHTHISVVYPISVFVISQ